MTPPPFSHAFRLLIIDDSANIHEDIRKILAPPSASSIAAMEAELFDQKPAVAAEQLRFNIDSAYQGEEGIAMAAKAKAEGAPYALAFVDMRMPPGMDGLGTIEKLWEIDPHLQAVICSAYSDYSWSEIVGRLGRNDRLVILRKPFENIEVLQLANCLTEKWNLQRQLEEHLNDLETIIAERTRELHQSQALARLILENANDLITVCDSAQRRIYSTPAHQRVLGYSEDEYSRAPAFAHVHPEDVAMVTAAAERLIAGGPRESLVVRKLHKEGFVLHFEIALDSMRDEAGRSAYLIVTSRDITERQRKEIQTRLNQKLESIGLLAAGVAHEINTPTQFISDNARFLTESFEQLKRLHAGYRDLLAAAKRQGVLTDEAKRAEQLELECELEYLESEIPRTLSQSLEGLDRVAKIVRSLKEFSHPGSPTRAPLDLNHALENAAMVCRHEWKYVADLDLQLDEHLPRVPCLADELNQALLNLIINAAHAIEAVQPKSGAGNKGVIRLRTHHTDTHAVVEVSDTGAGIPDAIRERIFEPFFTTKPQGKGTGQGLAITRAVVVAKHQGTIDFTSEVGKGTTFTIHLPLQVPQEKSANTKAA